MAGKENNNNQTFDSTAVFSHHFENKLLSGLSQGGSHSILLTMTIEVTKQKGNLDNHIFVWISSGLILISFMIGVYVDRASLPNLSKIKAKVQSKVETTDLTQCYETCSLSVVESVPQNLSVLEYPLPSTFEAWHYLITNAKHSIDLAAYKSSLRGKHVLGTGTHDYSAEGDQIFMDIENAGRNRSLHIRIVENSPSKDKGDNADGIDLFTRGAADRRTLNLQRIYHSGIMHSKFIVTDEKDFYMGSANLDWRSLNQKFEMGVLVKECPCLAKDLKIVFDFYWAASEAKNKDQFERLLHSTPSLSFNMNRPLKIKYKDIDTYVYISTSPKPVNSQQTWDLDAIVHVIESANTYLYINVMDFFPVFLYGPTREYWPVIDNAIRNAVLRGVNVKVVSAALHYPRMGLAFLKSLELINEVSKKGSINIRIFKVPSTNMMTLLQRERRTHKKFIVNDDSVVIASSNIAADYFETVGTGTAMVMRQKTGSPQPLIEEMRHVFERDFGSPYSHSLKEYYESCMSSITPAEFCEIEKDSSFLASPRAVS